ncbi:hypothetical protein CLF_111169, partial [Clonorchis sinensis]
FALCLNEIILASPPQREEALDSSFELMGSAHSCLDRGFELRMSTSYLTTRTIVPETRCILMPGIIRWLQCIHRGSAKMNSQARTSTLNLRIRCYRSRYVYLMNRKLGQQTQGEICVPTVHQLGAGAMDEPGVGKPCSKSATNSPKRTISPEVRNWQSESTIDVNCDQVMPEFMDRFFHHPYGQEQLKSETYLLVNS